MKVQNREDIAVVGGGITGVFAAQELANNGYNVTIFDEHPTLIAGTSGRAMTVHSGPEYSGSMPTAIDCLHSAIEFKKRFPEASGDHTVNYLVASDSQISMTEYQEFMDDLAGYYSSLPSEDHVLGRPELFYRAYEKDRFPFIKNIEGGIAAQDVTFNMDALRNRFIPTIGALGIRFVPQSGVKEVTRDGDQFKLDYTVGQDKHVKVFDQVVNTGGYKSILLDSAFGDKTPYALNFKTFHLVTEDTPPLPAFAVVRGNFMTHYPYPRIPGFTSTISALNAAGSSKGSIIQKLELNPSNLVIPPEIDEIMLSGIVPDSEKRTKNILDFISANFIPDARNRFHSVGLVPGVAVAYKSSEHDRNQPGPRELAPGYHTCVATKATHAPFLSRKILELVMARSISNNLSSVNQ